MTQLSFSWELMLSVALDSPVKGGLGIADSSNA